MTATKGRLEAQFTAEENWEVTVTTTLGGPVQVPIKLAGDTFYLGELLGDMETTLDAGGLGNWTISYDVSESASATGRVTITCNQATYTLAWSTTVIRDALGFTASVTQSAATQTSPKQAKGLWLPTCAKWTMHGDADDEYGDERSDMVYTMSPDGNVLAIYGEKYFEKIVRWSHVEQNRARVAAESRDNESFQQFYRDAHLGEFAGFQTGARVRLINDAALGWDEGVEYQIVEKPDCADPVKESGWTGLYGIELKLIKVPA